MVSINGSARVRADNQRASAGNVSLAGPSTPSLPRTLWDAWKAYTHRVAAYHTAFLLSIVYFLVLGPSGLLARFMGRELLDLAATPRASYWLARPPEDKSISSLRRQY